MYPPLIKSVNCLLLQATADEFSVVSRGGRLNELALI
jgi:hypothetical protein